MENPNLFHLQNTLSDYRIMISFSGRFTQGIIEELGEAVTKYLENENCSKKELVHIFSIFIEQTQNIKNYCLLKQNEPNYDAIANSGIVTIGKSDKGNYISSGNILEKKDIPNLVECIDKLIVMDKTALKKLYKETLKKEFNLSNRGAGLGLIDMARKASSPLEYSITEVDSNFSFFTLKAIV